MSLEQTWRWFGPKDPISLKEIKQTGVSGIVTALHQIPTGDVWPDDEIKKRKEIIEAEGLKWSVAESIPVHEDIKKRTGKYKLYIENYKQTIRNLGKCGVDTVCYNFMPVLDWSRTDLQVVFRDGTITTRFEANVMAAFDIYILKRSEAEKNYNDVQINSAEKYFKTLIDKQKEKLIETVLFGFPGSGEAYTLDGLKSAIIEYNEIGDKELRTNLYQFIREIIPAAEESGVLMGIHPDDPPWSLFGLPRIVSNKEDVKQILNAVDSNFNGITLCTGSFGASAQNDLVDMAKSFAKRINFIHLRNVTRDKNHNFSEEYHLDGDVDMYGVMKALILEQKRRIAEGRKDSRMSFRPDHGNLMIPDMDRKNVYPGYSLFGRMRGLAELRGLELGIRGSLE